MRALGWRTIITIVVGLATVVAAVMSAVALSQVPGERIRQFEPVRRPLSVGEQVTHVEVVAGDSAAIIGTRLAAAGTVDSRSRFELMASLFGWEQSLEPGVYSFEPGVTTYEVLRRIHFGETSPLRVVIPEGLRLEQVIARLAEASAVDMAVLRQALESTPEAVIAGTLSSQRPSGATLEGYLAPSAYSIPLDSTAEEITRLLVSRFDQLLDDELRTLIADSGRSLHEILTIASIIEREVVEPSEQRLVSAVIWNRLVAGMPLQMDPTVQYAVGHAGNWWTSELTSAQLAVDSAYNTYVVNGLPPGPIASPGVSAIEAAATPAQVPYLYFVARGDGTHAFSVTYEEHQANVERYRGGAQ